MKKKLLIFLSLLMLSISLIGCDKTNNKNREINIVRETHYVNTTESISVMSHNGFESTSIEKIFDPEKNTWTVIIVFEQFNENEWEERK